MTDPIRAALERLHQYAEIFPEHDTDLIVARARAALSADEPGTRLAVHPDGTPMVSIGEAADLDTIARLAADPEHARAESAEPEPPAEALAARPLLERVAAMGNCIGQHTVGEIMAISDRAAAWLAANPPGKPIAIEPRGCPTPGACSCVQPAPPAEGEVGELAEYLRYEAKADDALDHTHWLTAYQMRRAADLLEQRHPAPVPVVVPVVEGPVSDSGMSAYNYRAEARLKKTGSPCSKH